MLWMKKKQVFIICLLST